MLFRSVKDTIITITQPAQITGTLTASNSCPGGPIDLTFNAASGTGPFTVVINGTTYNNVSNGGIINTGVIANTAPVSIWAPSTVGSTPGIVDNLAIEVGVKFRANVAGQITGIRFYKLPGNSPPPATPHTGSLWTSTGTLLATATFSGETASGWQQVTFSTPVTITPGVTYVASYYTAVGNYAVDPAYFNNSGVTNAGGTLTALRTGVDGGNGVFKYVTGGGFPDQSFNGGNYWVDVVFNNTAGVNLFNLTSITSATGCNTTANPIHTVTVGIVPVGVAVVKTNLACLENTNGTFTITGSGGATPYTYSINGGSSYQSSGSFTGQSAGSYAIRVRDVNGCIKDTTVSIGVEVATWTGAVSSDWHTAGNWTTGQVPTSSTHVIIPAGTPICLISSSNAQAASVQVKTGAQPGEVRTENNRTLLIAGKCSILPPG